MRFLTWNDAVHSGLGLASAVIAAACLASKQPLQPRDLAQDIWRVRIDVDSAPARSAATQPVWGTIDFAAHRHSIDFWRAISHRLPNGAYVRVLSVASGEQAQYEITLGDSSSFDDKIVMLGRAATADSIIGTWSETIVCCSASGRFSLWRERSAPPSRAPRAPPAYPTERVLPPGGR